MRKVFLVYAAPDQGAGAQLAELLQSWLPDAQVVGRWLPEWEGPEAFLTTHAVVALVSAASLSSSEAPFVLGGAHVLEKPVFAVLADDIVPTQLSWPLPAPHVARSANRDGLRQLARQLAGSLGIDAKVDEAPLSALPPDENGEAPEGSHSRPAGGWVSEAREAWEYTSPQSPADERPTLPPFEDDEPSWEAKTAPGRPTPLSARKPEPASPEDAIIQAFSEVHTDEPAEPATPSVTPAPIHGIGSEPWPMPEGVETELQREHAQATSADGTLATPADGDERVSDERISGEQPSAKQPAPDDTQELWPVTEEDVTALPDGEDAEAPRAIPTRSDVAPAPSVLSAAPGCEASMEAGRAFSDCVFHREQGGSLRSELEVPFGNFVTALGGNWHTLRAMDDVDLWMEMADNVLSALPGDKQYVRWWYEVGFQTATLLNLANMDASATGDEDLEGAWDQAMQSLDQAVRAIGMSATEVAVLEGMLENLRGEAEERDFLNASRIQTLIRESAHHADAALSA